MKKSPALLRIAWTSGFVSRYQEEFFGGASSLQRCAATSFQWGCLEGGCSRAAWVAYFLGGRMARRSCFMGSRGYAPYSPNSLAPASQPPPSRVTVSPF